MRNPYELWESYHISNFDDLSRMVALFFKDEPLTGGFDTETTGLHIIKDKPFLIQFGWLIPKKDYGRVFTFYPTQEHMRIFFELAKHLKYFVAHNIKFDLHMTTNIGYAKEVQAMTNLVENMAVARLALEAVPSRDGGDSLKLKKLGEKYVHTEAGKSESIIKDELRKLKSTCVKILSAALKQFDHPDDVVYKPIRKDTGKATTSPYAQNNPSNVEWKWIPKKWNKKHVEDFLKDPTNDVDLLPDDVRDVWLDWQEEYPEPTYADVDRPTMIKYGGEDIITMLEFFKKVFPFLVKREQLPILQLESDCILPTYRMERIGLKVDMEYLEESRVRVQNYIRDLRNELYTLVGEKLTVNQHARIKQIYADKWGLELETSDNSALKKIIKEQEGKPKRFAQLIKALRSLEKWYSTYIKRIQQSAAYDGNVYTQINLNGAVSGRMSSDFQQFPKDPLKNEKGEVLYHPRKAFVPKGEGYESIVYIDYDQIELVTQAHYTLLVSGGDLNLCRAYMPFKCRHYLTGQEYDYRDSRERFRFDERQPNGESAWLDEEGNPWKKSDLHTITASKAYKDVPVDSEEFKKLYRPKGKTTNFASNYGGGPNALTGVLDISWEEAKQLVDGYNEAFPGVITYQQKIIEAHGKKGYVHNHFMRRYYISDSYKAYKLANYVVQGTAADALKKAVIELDKYLMDKNSKMVVPIHDKLCRV